ncbi:CoA transferase subunit beta [Bacillus sp. TS-2]|nr:CoA transferase subunit beta [Bacillus sp. TS-2]
MGLGIEQIKKMAQRAELEMPRNSIVNLGIGLPSYVTDYIRPEKGIMLQAENGILGMGSTPKKGYEDPMICHAGGLPTTIQKGGSFFDSTQSFAMIRGGYIDVAILGGLEVSEQGDLANWIIPGKKVSGIGGAIELAQKAKKLIIMMTHQNKNGQSKIVKRCQLPLTAEKCVNMIITEKAVIHVSKRGLELKEIFLPYSLEEVLQSTEASLYLSPTILRR